MNKNCWNNAEVLSSYKSFYQDISSHVGKDTIFVFSIGSFVSSNNSYNSTIQMHPPFADELARNGSQVYVYNIDHCFQHAPKSQPALQEAVVHYVSQDFNPEPQITQLVSDIFDAGGKIILIDNTSKKMTDFTRQIATEHHEKIHKHLEVVHRYIGLFDGVACLYHQAAFDGTVNNTGANIAHAMRIANECDSYAGAGNQMGLRENFINTPEEYQESIKELGKFFAAGLADISADDLFQLAAKNTEQNSSEQSYSVDDETQQEIEMWWENLKLFLFVLLVVFTFPVSLPILGAYYHHCKKNEQAFNPLGIFENKKMPLNDVDLSIVNHSI